MNVKVLHLEVTGDCNALCLGCSRTSDMSKKAERPLQSSHLNNEIFNKIRQSKSFQSVEFIYLCGVLGDPLAHPHLASEIEEFFRLNQSLKIQIHTNGSLGAKSTWNKLGDLSKDYDLEVVFSIDGLEDTNHLYRQGVPFESVMENAKNYITCGGQAIWKWIEFDVNKHQIEEGRKKAKELNFKEFQVRQSYDPNRVPGKLSLDEVLIQKKWARPHKDTSTEELTRVLISDVQKGKPISCQAKEHSEIYIDSFARVWPCCWIGNLGLERLSIREREHFHRTVLSRYQKDFNLLVNGDLDEILGHRWFQKDLEASWANDPRSEENPCSPTCLKYCGKSL